MADITDGTSNTLFMSEVLMAREKDWDSRGDLFNDDGPGGSFMTNNTPNSTTPDAPQFCLSDPANPPCATGTPTHIAARSKHPGGVNALFADGSVHFMSETIALAVWQGLGTSKGAEAVQIP
jgi:prepilin-type processing-associated H-X9-DG protein